MRRRRHDTARSWILLDVSPNRTGRGRAVKREGGQFLFPLITGTGTGTGTGTQSYIHVFVTIILSLERNISFDWKYLLPALLFAISLHIIEDEMK